MTRTKPRTKEERAREEENRNLDELLINNAKVQIFTHSFARNQIRHDRRERISPITPSQPNPELSALDYQHRELVELVSQLDAMANVVLALQKSNRARHAAYAKLLRGK